MLPEVSGLRWIHQKPRSTAGFLFVRSLQIFAGTGLPLKKEWEILEALGF